MFYKEILYQSFFLSLIQLVTCFFFVTEIYRRKYIHYENVYGILRF